MAMQNVAMEGFLVDLRRSNGGNLTVNISTTGVEVLRDVGIGVVSTAVTLSALYTGYKLMRSLIESAVKRGIGGEKDVQEIRDVKPRSLNVRLHCSTDERFLEVLEDFECGRLKDRLQEEFLQTGIKIEGVKVEILNKEEVSKTEEAINERQMKENPTPARPNQEKTPDQGPESSRGWKWEASSIVHQEKFFKLQEVGKNHPEEIQEINGVRVCCSEEFLIGKGGDGTRVYVGLGEDGYERAVKRLPRDSCACSIAEQEKNVLNEFNTTKSNHVVKYWFLDDKSDKHYLFLILDLCEETLKNFIHRSNLDDLVKFAPNIIQQVLKGLADLHRDPKPILHRDLKPSNILRDVHGNWLLADFGISRILTRGDSTHRSVQRGTDNWRAVESYPPNGMSDDGKVRYKKESDIQVAGMVAFCIVTKGGHPFGEVRHRLDNLLNGKPVGLDTLKNPILKDLLSWMLSHDPKDRPSAEEALKHPYLLPKKQQFELLCEMGNQEEIKRGDVKSDVVRRLNSNPKDWKSLMRPDILNYLCTDSSKGKTFRYRSTWTECLRLIRNVKQHWHENPRPRPEAFYVVGDPQEYFLDLFPYLPVEVHRIVRSCDWKKRPDLKEYFI